MRAARIGGRFLAPVFMICALTATQAAEIRVFTSGAPSAALQALAPAFTEATGQRISFTIGVLNEIREKMSGAERPDAVVLPVPAIDALDKTGKLRPDSRLVLARVGIGIVVREGAPLPDISTPDAVRKTMLAARSIAHTDPHGGGFAGAQVVRMFEKLGIAEAVKPKVTLMYAITGGVARVAKGEAEIGLFNISEILPVKGVTLVGPLPPELQSYIVFAAAIHANSAVPDAAAAYLRFLSEPSSRDAWSKAGFESLGGR